MFKALRQVCFKFFGGFTIADFYIATVNLPPPPTPPRFNFLSSYKKGENQAMPTTAEDTLREDLVNVVQGNPTLALGLATLIIGFGGFASAFGAATALLSDTAEGLDVYIYTKDTVCDIIDEYKKRNASQQK